MQFRQQHCKIESMLSKRAVEDFSAGIYESTMDAVRCKQWNYTISHWALFASVSYLIFIFVHIAVFILLERLQQWLNTRAVLGTLYLYLYHVSCLRVIYSSLMSLVFFSAVKKLYCHTWTMERTRSRSSMMHFNQSINHASSARVTDLIAFWICFLLI